LALADTAMKAAQKAKADSLATDQFRKAENYYLRAKKDFAEGYFDSCKKFANQARMTAEQAEFLALKKQSVLKNKPVDDDSSASAPAPADPFNAKPTGDDE
jgi:hypothetical protein